MKRQLQTLKEQLSDRDIAILTDLEMFRLLTTRHIQRLHFADGHRTVAAGTRACTRVLGRLAAHGLIAHLARRIGGVRQGSATLTWQLAATGERLLRSLRGNGQRRRYVEPAREFVEHTLAIADAGVALREAASQRLIELPHLAVEHRAWRQFVGPHGGPLWLRPDLHAVTASDEFEQHWLIEVDRDTERERFLERKLATYAAYYRSGRYQAEHDLFPTVLWVVPSDRRARTLSRLANDVPLPIDLFQFCRMDAFIEHVLTETLGPQAVPLPGILQAADGTSIPNTSKGDDQ